MHYVVRKTGKGWSLTNNNGTNCGTFATKREAVFTGRLLAGWSGTCVVATKRKGA